MRKATQGHTCGSLFQILFLTFVSLGKFILKYFILFVAVVNGIVSLISLCFFIVSI